MEFVEAVNTNELFENTYTTNIEVMYGPRRDYLIDNNLIDTNSLPHMHCVNARVNCTPEKSYSIDPEGCEDADDAFSIYSENGNIILDIHIADPTEYVNPTSTLWSDIVDRTITRYPSNRIPIHMLPYEVMEKSSLMQNKYGDIKKAITVRTYIDENTFCPKGDIQILFSHIRVSRETQLTYSQASRLKYTNKVIATGIKISNALMELRYKNTIGTKLNEVCRSRVIFCDDGPCFHKDSPEEIEIKQMIAEFAIFANSFVGEYLKLHFNGLGIFRTCEATKWLETLDNNMSGDDLINKIITDGIKAEYVSTPNSHDLVGAPSYCHFTSPMRRLSDCVCHYILKYIHLEKNKKITSTPFLEPIFTDRQLDYFSERSHRISKSMKNVQHKDNKFRIIQTMSKMLQNEPQRPLEISFFFTAYNGLFINIIINKINEHDTYLSYSLRNTVFEYPNTGSKYKMLITLVNLPNRFDQGTIPELDEIIVNNTYHNFEIQSQASVSLDNT
jgi:exoribonuclease R